MWWCGLLCVSIVLVRFMNLCGIWFVVGVGVLMGDVGLVFLNRLVVLLICYCICVGGRLVVSSLCVVVC